MWAWLTLQDKERLDSMHEQATALLPDLRARLAALQAELAGEREVVREIEACDQDELRDLREAMTEQGWVAYL
jgi:kinetochore protein Spc7/SPC105